MRIVYLAAALAMVAGQASAQSTADAATAVQTKPVGGAVNANGTAQLSPTTFTVSHPSTGRYIITFKKPFPKYAICVFESIGAATHVASAGVNANSCDVTFFSAATNQAADTLFVFVAANAG